MRIDNEFKNLIAPLTSEEYLKLEESILAEGCREPIIFLAKHYNRGKQK